MRFCARTCHRHRHRHHRRSGICVPTPAPATSSSPSSSSASSVVPIATFVTAVIGIFLVATPSPFLGVVVDGFFVRPPASSVGFHGAMPSSSPRNANGDTMGDRNGINNKRDSSKNNNHDSDRKYLFARRSNRDNGVDDDDIATSLVNGGGSNSTTTMTLPDPSSKEDAASSSSSGSCSLLSSRLTPLRDGHRRVYLLRHGETDWNLRGMIQGGGYDISLNRGGMEQASVAANQLKSFPITAVASSHLQRSKQTADVVADAVLRERRRARRDKNSRQQEQQQQDDEEQEEDAGGVKRVIREGFGEMRFGMYEGLAYKGEEAKEETKLAFMEYIVNMRKDRSLPWPGDGGESIADVERRCRNAFRSVLDEHPDHKHIVIVGHGRCNKILISAILNMTEAQYDKLDQGNTCINVLDVANDDDGSVHPVVLNFVDHITSDTARSSPSWN